MNFKKAVVIITAVAIMTGALAGCSQENAGEQAQATAESVAEQQSTKAVEASEVQTTAKADKKETAKKGETTAVSTSAKSSTTAKGQTTTNGKTTTKKSNTTKKSAPSKKGSKAATTTTTAKQNNGTTAKSNTTKADNAIKINLLKNGNAECKSSNVTVDAPSVFQTDGIVYIEKGGDYVITSSTEEWHGQIVIKLANTESANIRFENVNISTQKANAVKILDTNIKTERSFIETEISSGSSAGDTDNALKDEMKEVSKNEKAPNVDLSFPTGTTSTFTTNSGAASGIIYNESKLTIKGNGTVNLKDNPKKVNNIICSTKSVTFKNVTANLTTSNQGTGSTTSAKGIFSFSKVYVESGTLNINSYGDGIRCEEFNSSGGKTSINSVNSDGIDADDGIIITGGTVDATALNKSCYKVRRVNNQEKIDANDPTVKESDGVTKATHTFKIDGGTVTGEGKNITTVQKASKQASITCRSVKSAGSEEAKKLLQFTIKGDGVNVTSPDKCIKYLYSSPSVNKAKEYTVSSKGYASKKAVFNGTVGDVRIEAV